MVTDVVSRQYPHYLYRYEVGEATQDENGSWQTASESWVFHSVCREETNGKGIQIQATNGQFITFASLVQLPKGTQRVPEGTLIAVAEMPLEPSQLLEEAKAAGVIRVSGDCLKFDNGRLHCRIWV